MQVGVPKEIKNHEYRVGLTPLSVKELVQADHDVLVEAKAGDGAGFSDESYQKAGAKIASNAADIFERADMIVKVKELQPNECGMLRPGQVLFTFLHLAPDPEQAEALLEANVVAIAYETVTDKQGRLPILTPMSEVAGRMAVQVGAHHLEKSQSGRGVLLGGVPGVAPGNVLIIGAGVSGSHALEMAVGLGAHVCVINRSLSRLRDLDALYKGRIETRPSTASAIEQSLGEADLIIGAVLVPGAAAPKLATRAMIAQMKPGSVIVDISIDQGGCFETSKPTSHSDPTYVVDGVTHYCVTNIPGAVPRTSTLALNNATLPFVLELATTGHERALAENAHLAAGLNIYRGTVAHPAVARDLGKPYVEPTFT